MDEGLSITDLTMGVWRRIYSGFLHGQRINAVSMQAEAWFWRVYAIADDFGNFRGNPDSLRCEAAPRRPVSAQQVVDWMKELEDSRLVVRYLVSGDSYYHIQGFVERNPPNKGKNGKPQRMVRRVPEWDGTEKQVIPGCPGFPDAHRVPHNHNHDHNNPPAPKGACAEEDPPGFARFWQSWPKHHRKEDRRGCCKAWDKLGCEEIADAVLDGLARWKSSHDWTKQDGQFIPAPLPWLRKRRWETAGELKPATQDPLAYEMPPDEVMAVLRREGLTP